MSRGLSSLTASTVCPGAFLLPEWPNARGALIPTFPPGYCPGLGRLPPAEGGGTQCFLGSCPAAVGTWGTSHYPAPATTIISVNPFPMHCHLLSCSCHVIPLPPSSFQLPQRERYIQLNAEFQGIVRRDKKAFLSEQCKETGKQEWERLEISSRKLETSREHFLQRWAQ